MSAKPLNKIGLLLATVAFALSAAGCSTNPPCETNLALVDDARGAAKVAEDKLDDAQSQQSDLQKQIDSEKAKQASLEEQKADLLAKIAELEQ